MTQEDLSPAAAPNPARHLIVFTHPGTDSFGHRVVEAYRAAVHAEGQEVFVRDLYALGFDPVLKDAERPPLRMAPARDVQTELDLLASASVLVLIYPIWFGLPPAMLKGYVDRVLGSDYTIGDLQDRRGQHVLQGKPLLSFSTSGASFGWLDQNEQVLSLRKIFDAYLWQGFGMMRSEHVRLDEVTSAMTVADAEAKLAEVAAAARRTCALL